ncbi:MAG: transposase [Clostridia bacterium]
MARQAREILKGKYFHVLVAGISELSIFAEHKNKMFYIELLKSVENVTLLAYSIMDNHAHLVFSSAGISPIADVMKKIDTTFALFFNKNKKRSGYVFNGRFKCQVLQNEAETAACIGFVHNNPLFDNPRFSIKTYPYSSYKMYSGKNESLQEFAVNAGQTLDTLEQYIITMSDNHSIFGWLDVRSFVLKEDYNTVLNDLADKLEVSNYSDVALDKAKMGAFAYELNKRTGASLLYICQEMGVNRETLRRAVKQFEKNMVEKDNA